MKSQGQNLGGEKLPAIGATVKSLLGAIATLPIAVAIWFAMTLSSQDSQGQYLGWVTIIGMIFLSLLLTPLMIRVASTQFLPDGVEQTVFFQGRHLWQRKQVKWQAIEKVMFKQIAYTFFSKDAQILLLLACFSDHEQVISYVNGRLPKEALWVSK